MSSLGYEVIILLAIFFGIGAIFILTGRGEKQSNEIDDDKKNINEPELTPLNSLDKKGDKKNHRAGGLRLKSGG
jgi:hypothetical protein